MLVDSLIFKVLETIVLKIGPDRPVGPVEPGTGQVFGPVITSRTVFRKPEENRPKTAELDKPDRFKRLGGFLFSEKNHLKRRRFGWF